MWVCMGAGRAAAVRAARVGALAGTRTSIVKMRIDANWAQVLEGAIDSAHSSTLHATDMPPARVEGARATATVWRIFDTAPVRVCASLDMEV